MLQKLKICDAAKKFFLIQIAHLTGIFLCGKLWSEVKDMKKFRDNIFVRIICWIFYIIWSLLRPLMVIVSRLIKWFWGIVCTLYVFCFLLGCCIDGWNETVNSWGKPFLITFGILIILTLLTQIAEIDPSFLIRRNNEEEIQPETAPIKRVVKATERQEVHYDPVKGDVTYSVERTAVGVELDQDGETVIVQEYPINQNEIK